MFPAIRGGRIAKGGAGNWSWRWEETISVHVVSKKIESPWTTTSGFNIQLESATQLSLSVQTIRSSTVFSEVFVLGVRVRIEF